MAFHSREVDILKKLTAARVLELGCGLAQTAPVLCENFTQVYGIEPMQSPISRADFREHIAEHPNFSFTVATGEALPFERGFFDGVVSHWALHHYRYPLAVLGEAHRVLREGGWLLLSDAISHAEGISLRQANHLAFHRLAVAADRKMHVDHFPARAPEHIIELLQAADFAIDEAHVVAEEDLDTYTDDVAAAYLQNIRMLQNRLDDRASAEKSAFDALIEKIEREGIAAGPFVAILAHKRVHG